MVGVGVGWGGGGGGRHWPSVCKSWGVRGVRAWCLRRTWASLVETSITFMAEIESCRAGPGIGINHGKGVWGCGVI